MTDIHIKFFSNDKDVSDNAMKALGIPFSESEIRARPVDEHIEQRHISKMQSAGLEEVRPGRGDTGHQVFGPKGLSNICVDKLPRLFAEQGYAVVQVYRERKPVRDRQSGAIVAGKNKYVITIVFSNGLDGKPLENSNELIANATTFFAGKVVSLVHVWDNGGVVTVNLAGGFQQGKPAKVRELCVEGPKVQFFTRMMETPNEQRA